MISDNVKFSIGEQADINEARKLETRAKALRKRANADRKLRVERGRAQAAQEDARINAERKDLSDRVMEFAKGLSLYLASHQLKFADNSAFDGPQTTIILLDQKSQNTVELKAVNGKGFEWGLIDMK